MMLPPPKLSDMPAGAQLRAGRGESTVIADFDFETYSPAGFVWGDATNKWGCLPNANAKGLGIVGAAKYTEHPDAEVLCLAYDLKDGLGRRLWKPEFVHHTSLREYPDDLFEHVLNGGLLEAWNVPFESWVWNNICVPKYGFPPLPIEQLRCAMAKSRAFALPGSLANAGDVLDVVAKKDKDGDRLIKRFCIPRDPTKTDTRKRILPQEDTVEAQNLYNYCLRDIETEAEISSRIPDLNDFEQEFWLCDLKINKRGVAIDLESVHNAIKIVEQAHAKYNAEIFMLTEGAVSRASECAKIIKWVNNEGVFILDLTSDIVEIWLKKELPGNVRRVLEIRQMIGSAAVKKLYAMANQVTNDGRLHDLFIYHSARTGRAAGAWPQPQNLPNSGPEVRRCGSCLKYRTNAFSCCPWCAAPDNASGRHEWDIDAVEDVITTINTGSLETVEYHFGNAIAAVSGCLRGMFVAKPGYDLICSDYSAIEAVVLAQLAGEEWRNEVFRTHGKIYEMSASKVTGTTLEEFEEHKRRTGSHHKDRKTGKVLELALGYSGWIGAMVAFGADAFMTEEQMKTAILAWRKASPAIVEFWGGQFKDWNPCMFGVEGTSIQAILNPGHAHWYRGMEFINHNDVLYIRLLSGRFLTYHKPRCAPHPPDTKRKGLEITYEGWNSNAKYGKPGWQRMPTYGGRLVENIVQATARDILANAVVNLEREGIPVVLHVHDEIVCEVQNDWGTNHGDVDPVEELEKIMSTMPAWAEGWSVKASGGWRGKRYRK